MRYFTKVRVIGSRITKHAKPLLEGLDAIVGAFSGLDKPITATYHSIAPLYHNAVHVFLSAPSYARRLVRGNGHGSNNADKIRAITRHRNGSPPFKQRHRGNNSQRVYLQQVNVEVDNVLAASGCGGSRLGAEIWKGQKNLAKIDYTQGIVTTSDPNLYRTLAAAINSCNDSGRDYRIKVSLI